MKKLKLDLDQIQVLSFTAGVEPRVGGTVRAFEPDTDIGCGGGSGESCESCFPNYCPNMPASAGSPC